MLPFRVSAYGTFKFSTCDGANWDTYLRIYKTLPDGSTESVRWDDLQRVAIQTTDQGPWFEDVWWVLVGAEGGCLVPQGADVVVRPIVERVHDRRPRLPLGGFNGWRRSR